MAEPDNLNDRDPGIDGSRSSVVDGSHAANAAHRASVAPLVGPARARRPAGRRRAIRPRKELPLWQEDRLSLLAEFWAAGLECRIVVVREGLVDRRYVGRVLDENVAAELASAGIDACGENGEFHTLVTSGPLFRHPLSFALGQQVLRSGCWFQDVLLG